MKMKIFLGLLAILIAAIAITFVLRSKHALVVQPKGVIAKEELSLMKTNILLMLTVIIPTYLALFIIAWKYRSKNVKKDTDYDPDYSSGPLKQALFWLIPSAVIAVMAVITWEATHRLDPFRPLESDVKPLTIQVVAMDWKWLFIYPEQGVASLNFVQFPAQTPIRFELLSDNSPINSFWIPQLSGQIYAMTGMVTQLHLMADEIGEYAGKAVEINGEGYASMTFVAKATSSQDFDGWLAQVRRSPQQLTDAIYNELVKPSVNRSVILYSQVEENLFHRIMMKYSSPPQ